MKSGAANDQEDSNNAANNKGSVAEKLYTGEFFLIRLSPDIRENNGDSDIIAGSSCFFLSINH